MINHRFYLFVPGRAVPQGSKTAFVSKSTGRPIVVDKDVRLPQWRMKITAAALEKRGTDPTLTGPVGARITFFMERPQGHYGTGKNAATLKPSAPGHPATMPDIDKLLRAVFDALTDAQVWADDGQVVWCQTIKTYADGTMQPGVEITVGAMH